MKKHSAYEVEDLQLAKACLNGNEKAQAKLYHQYAGQMMSLCYRYGSDLDEAQEMFQEGFIKVFQKLDKYDGKGPLGAWIRRTMSNHALDMLRKNSRRKLHISLTEVDFKIEDEDALRPFEEELEALNMDELLELVHQMPTGYRTVFNLYAVEEYAHKEIAEQLGISESTSKTQYRKAKAYMKKLLEQKSKASINGQG